MHLLRYIVMLVELQIFTSVSSLAAHSTQRRLGLPSPKMTVSNPLRLPERVWRAVIQSLWILNPLVVLALLPSVHWFRWLPWWSLIDVTFRNALPVAMRVPLIDFAIPVYVVRELIWFLLHGQYLIIARYDLFSSYKINQTARQPFDVQWFMFDAMNLDHLVSMPILLAISIYSWRAIKVNLDFNTVPSPLALFGMLVLSRFVREFLRYWGHRFLHMGLLYKLIHKKHHEYTSPFSLVGEYAHPVENIVHGIIPIVAGMFTLAYSFGELHIVTLYLDLLWMTVISVEEHGLHAPLERRLLARP